MAIIQISKIQQRSGNLVDLPQLDEAQFGWATDAKRLFIGKTAPNENIEVLTSYSNISFSQIDGSDGSNVFISNVQPGQTLAYDTVINSWVNTGGNVEDPGNSSYFSGQPIHLGSVSNVKIGDGAVGYVLTTDGYGNLSWSSKTTVIANIIDLSNANPAVMTVDANIVSYTNGTAVTILGIGGNSSANANLLNGNTFYVKVANDFNTTGNVSLYISDALDSANRYDGAGIVYDNPANTFATATSTFGTSGSSPAAGVEGSIQYNVSGVLTGSALLKFANSNVEISSSNIVVTGGNVSANLLTGTLTTAAQPNITSTGTLAGLVVAGNITPSANITYNLGNNTNRFNDIYLANSTIYIGDQTISANSTNVIISGILTANVSGNISGNATTAGTVTTAAQPNITSVGTLTSLAVTGNITAGNISGANAITANYFIGSGNNLSNIQGANVTGAVSYASTANAVALANVSGAGNIASVNLDGSTSNVLYGNGVFGPAAVSYGNSEVATFLASYGSNTITTTGNVSVGNIIGNGQALTSIAGANVTGTVSSATTAGTVTTAAQPNITSTGTLTSLSVSGNANIGNLGTAGVFATTLSATGNANVGNLFSLGTIGGNAGGNAVFLGDGGLLSNINIAAGSSIVNGNSNVSVGANSNVVVSVSGTSNVVVITNTGIDVTGTVSASGNITAGNVSATLFTGALSGTLTSASAAQPNVTSLGTLTSLSVSGNANVGNLNTANAGIIGGNNVTFTTGSNTNAGTFTGNFSLSTGSRLNATYADLAEYYEADQPYEPGTVLAFGGDKEVTIAEDGTSKVAGVVSTDPAYVMNTKCQGEHIVALALQGRVPTKVRGTIRKGDMLVSGGDGYARPANNPTMGTVIGKSLENFTGEGIIEVAVGRL